MSKKIKLALLWHMHQPFYKDPMSGLFEMPWVRLHALKDYWGMVAMLEEFPQARVTFNLMPSLISQLEDFLANPDVDPLFTLAFAPVTLLTEEQKWAMLENFFQANYERQISRFPRFEELRRRTHVGSQSTKAGFAQLSSQDLIDLQVLSQVCWFDEIYLEKDPVVRMLKEKGYGFTEEDKEKLREKELELVTRVIPKYREALERGQIEISTSPFFHPILPLLCNISVAQRAQPDVILPGRPFNYPEDAALQIELAINQFERLFGHRPTGMWPPEGAVSNAALDLIARNGFGWTATDEGVLGRSFGVTFHRTEMGEVSHPELLYAPVQFGDTPLKVFFRDQELSDALGFVYSRMSAADAVSHFIGRLKAAVSTIRESGACVAVILDGENAWEFYPENGRPFLREFYGRLSTDGDIEMVTFSQACEQLNAQAKRLDEIWPGSWIHSNFAVWVGDREDNRAWELLADARETFEKFIRSHRPPADDPRVVAARQSLLVAEGSDWCWWYGPEHSTVNDLRFDRLFRSHLINCYQQLGLGVPATLAEALKRRISRQFHRLPTSHIAPIVDGEISNYFEWLGAGVIEESGTTMRQGKKYVERVFYGWNEEWVHLRIDFPSAVLTRGDPLNLKILFGANTYLLIREVTANHDSMPVIFRDDLHGTERELKTSEATAVFKRIFECRFRRFLYSTWKKTPPAFFLIVEINGTPVDRIPLEGNVTVGDDLFE
jgi:alpha-amylase/alpha-mannosidase (GH57 family)